MNDISFEIYSNFGNIPPVLNSINSYSKQCGFSDKDSKKITIATEEVITNIIKHSYDYKKDKKIIIELNFVKKTLSIKILHYGNNFAINNKKINVDIEKIQREKKKGGFGLFIIKNFMDEFTMGKEGKWSYTLIKKTLKK